jgi:HK97 family phage portal protein
VSIASRAAKTITWTFDTSVSVENDIIRERVLLDEGGTFTGAGLTVDRAIRVISENIASLPLQVFERLPKGKRLAPDHRLYGMLHDAPNPEMTSMVFREAMQSHIEAWGNAYAEIEYDTDGFPLYLWPLRPDRMTVVRDDGQLVYLYRTLDGKEQRLSKRQVFHIPGIGYDGRIGYSPIHMARQAIALGQAVEEFAGRFYANDARPGIAIMLGPEYEYDDDAKKRLAESFDATHAGLKNKHRTAVLDEGMGLEQIGWPPELGKLVSESQKWDVPTTSRIFNLSPHMLHDLERSTFNNIEEQGLNVSTYQFRPRTVRWEQQIKLQLMREDTRHFAEHNLDGFLRGKMEDRMKAYWQMFQMGAISPNEIRASENRNQREDDAGDQFYVPVNIESVSEDEEETPVLPPLQLATRSSKALDRAVVEKYEPLFEDVTRNLIDLERRMVMREAEKRLAASQSESTKSMVDALTEIAARPQGPTSIEMKLPDSFSLESQPINVTVPEQPAPQVTVDTSQFAKALRELRDEIRAPRTRKIIRDDNNVITGVFEESA